MLTKSQFKKVIKEEFSTIAEGAGGGCGCASPERQSQPDYDIIYTSTPDMPDEIVSDYSGDLEIDISRGHGGGQLSREAALDKVEAIAMMTSCPKTREVLLSAIDQLEYMTGEMGTDLDMGHMGKEAVMPPEIDMRFMDINEKLGG